MWKWGCYAETLNFWGQAAGLSLKRKIWIILVADIGSEKGRSNFSA